MRTSVYCLNPGCAGILFTDVTFIAVIDADFNFNVFHITRQTVSFPHKLFENLVIIPIHKIDHKEKETKRKTKRKTDRLMTYLLILKFGYVFSLFLSNSFCFILQVTNLWHRLLWETVNFMPLFLLLVSSCTISSSFRGFL